MSGAKLFLCYQGMEHINNFAVCFTNTLMQEITFLLEDVVKLLNILFLFLLYYTRAVLCW